jgi:ABC-2 type transport system ATP-binding protein
MRQRLGIAQAIMEDPKLLVLDEPFNGLDADGVEEIRELLQTYRNEGKLIILSSHMKEDLEILCDEVFYMDKGQIKE